MEKELVVSADVLQAVDLRSEITVENQHEVSLRGHDSPTRMFSLTREDLNPAIKLNAAEEYL
ncbi:MAG: hypothetical protein ABJD51_22945 [Roseobacter sp.]